MNLHNIIYNAEKYELTGEDIKKFIPDCLIIAYHNLKNYNSIDEIFNKYNTLFLLYETKENYGHWCVLNRINNNTIEFFDPYGYKLDQELKYSNYNLNDKGAPHLTDLFNNSNYKVYSNIYKFQKEKKDVNTCARHCIVRTKFIKIPIIEYKNFFGNSNPDYFVSAMTIINSL